MFAGNVHFGSFNRTNPLGMKGHIAQRYGELVKDLWAGTSKSIAPLKFRVSDVLLVDSLSTLQVCKNDDDFNPLFFLF